MIINSSSTGQYNLSADDPILVVTSTGSISSSMFGVDTKGLNGAVVTNSGDIAALKIGVDIFGNGQIFTNTASGSATGGIVGVLSESAAAGASNNVVFNSGLITGTHYGFADYDAGSDIIVNHGTISGGLASIYAGSDSYLISSTTTNLTIINDGMLDGNVVFNGGGNVFQGVNGTVNGDIIGSTGSDTFDLSSQHVTGTINGGGGSDAIAFASAAGAFAIDLGDGTAYGAGEAFTFSGIENATGSAYADTINGDDNVNAINGGAGNDVINGNGGADVINAGAGADTVMAGPGNDVVNGNGGADILYGNGGSDTITGGAGADTLTGGAGADTFVYSLVTDSPTSGPDLITDFVHGADKIDLTALHLANAGDVKITSSGGLTYITIDANNDGTADMQINLTGTNILTASDIVGIPAAAPAAHVATTNAVTTTITHHDLATNLHAVALEHGLFG